MAKRSSGTPNTPGSSTPSVGRRKTFVDLPAGWGGAVSKKDKKKSGKSPKAAKNKSKKKKSGGSPPGMSYYTK